MTIEEIKQKIENGYNIYSFEGYFEEIESFSDIESEPKYKYKTIIFEYLPDSTFYKILLQQSSDGNVDLETTWKGKTTKIETITYEWN